LKIISQNWKWDIIILDEVNLAITYGFIDVNEFLIEMTSIFYAE